MLGVQSVTPRQPQRTHATTFRCAGRFATVCSETKQTTRHYAPSSKLGRAGQLIGAAAAATASAPAAHEVQPRLQLHEAEELEHSEPDCVHEEDEGPITGATRPDPTLVLHSTASRSEIGTRVPN